MIDITHLNTVEAEHPQRIILFQLSYLVLFKSCTLLPRGGSCYGVTD